MNAFFVLLALLASSFAGTASAQAFSGAPVIESIVAYGLIAVGIVGAFILARWGVKAMGLLR